MELYPAIDLRAGKVVRLLHGDYDTQTTYGDDPVAVARSFERAGAQWIHVVDLDAARDGGRANLPVIGRICAAVSVNVQNGGGVRTRDDARARFDAGVARVVVGSAAVEDPAMARALAGEHPGGVAVGLDARGNEVAIHGWTKPTGLDVADLAAALEGVAALIVTQINVDGALTGPATGQYEELLDATKVPLIASGGVGELAHLRELARLPLEGVIVGKAIYEKRFTVEEGIAACSAPV